MKQDPSQATFSHLLLSGTLVHEGSFTDMQRFFGIGIHPHVVMLISIDRYPELAIGQPFRWRVDIGRKLVDSVCEGTNSPFVWVWVAEGVLAVLLELASDDQKKRHKEITLASARSIQQLSDAHGFYVSVGIGGFYDNPYMLHYSFEEAKESMIDRFFEGKQIIFQYEQRRTIEHQMKNPILPHERTELMSRAKIGDEEGAIAMLKIILDRMAQAYRTNVDMFKSEVIELIVTMSRMVLDSGVNPTVILSENVRFIQNLYATIRYDIFVQKVCDYWRKLMKEAADTQVWDTSETIRKAIRYIKENLQRKISLEEVAQYCHLSIYHFSHLFKKEVSLSVIDFLNKIRIEKAIYYLETTTMTIQEITGMVGFQDANYFSRTFKKYMNVTPTEYRSAKLC